MSLGLRDGFIEFRFELGRGPVVIRSENPIQLDIWHRIKIVRKQRDGSLVVDDQPEVSRSAPGHFIGLDLAEPLYIGSVPDFSLINRAAGYTEGFVGCISLFRIGSSDIDLRSAAVAYGVTPCDTCRTRTCGQGSCREALVHEGHECHCPSGLSGARCEKQGEGCYPGVCGHGSRCTETSGGVAECHCPFGRTGARCDRDLRITEPRLPGGQSAFIAYSTPTNILSTFKVVLKIKPSSAAIDQDGLLIYSGQSEDGAGDFVAVTLRNKSVEFTFDTGSGAATLRSVSIIEPDEWVTIVASREFNEGTLIVGSLFPPVRGRTPGNTRGLNLRTPFYVGGVDRLRTTIATAVGVTNAFDGCFSSVEVNGRVLDMSDEVLDSADVEECANGASACARQPCKNGGGCVDVGSGLYQCRCQPGYSGSRCENEQSMCDILTDPCKNGGHCQPMGQTFRCCCDFGYTGESCLVETRYDQEEALSVSFNGDGYASFDSSLLPHLAIDEHEVIRLSFSTTSSEGLLFYHGIKPGQVRS